MYKKTIFIVIIFFNFFIPILVNAEVSGADSQIPELNPFCWKRKDCIDARRKFVEGNQTDEELAKNGFISNASVAPCNTGTGADLWGRCLPAGVTKTEIDFGGRASFSNIGDFILVMYKYLVTIASVLSVIMIIVAGVQWITSGGNSESISSAKHRIGGALIGLFIAYMSYFILNTINPNLINFRLPQVWLVRPQNLVPEFCSEIPNYQNIKFAFVSGLDRQSDPLPPLNSLSYFKADSTNPLCCGCGFIAENGGTARCMGHVCKKPNDNERRVCANGGPDFGFGCYPGDLAITLFVSDVPFEEQAKEAALKVPYLGALASLVTSKPMEDDWLYHSPVVRAVCKTATGELFLANDGGGVSWSNKVKETTPEKTGSYYKFHVFFSGLSDREEANKIFSCEAGRIPTGELVDGLPTYRPAVTGEIVGYFIRYEVNAKRSWFDARKTRLKSMGAGGAAGAAIGSFIVPGLGTAGGFVLGELGGAVVGLVIEDGPPRPNLNIGYENGQAIFGLYASPAARKSTPMYEVIADIRSLASYIPIDKMNEDGGVRLNISFNFDVLNRIGLYKGSVPRNDNELFWLTPSSTPTQNNLGD
jgi:hypothetical protein